MVGPFSEHLETAQFGLGCFWGAERVFWKVPGVYTTAVGYAAGYTPHPTYQEVCTGQTGHNEVVLVVFNPTLVSYADLLRVFWESHDPTQGMRQGNDWGTQYRSGIYTYSDAQVEAAKDSRDEYDQRLKGAGYSGITTEIQAATEFYYAEGITSNIWIRTRRVIAVLAAPAWPAVLARVSRPKPVPAKAKRYVLVETTPTQ